MDGHSRPTDITRQSLDELEELDVAEVEAAGVLDSPFSEEPTLAGESDVSAVSVFFEASLLSPLSLERL